MSISQLASPFPTATTFRRRRPVGKTVGKTLAAASPTLARNEPGAQLGGQIRALRIAAGMSAGALARSSGISASLLSRVERGFVSPSVDSLTRIAKGLNVSLARFFSDQHQRSDFSVVRAGQGIVVDRLGAVADYRYELLGHVLSGNLFVEPYRVELMPDAKPYISFQHPGLKFLHMTDGRVRYHYAGKVVEIEKGDSLLFEASALHGIEQILSGPVSYLVAVFTVRE
jgi:transcriptional regulator with XRE-family HTH domain